MPNWPKHRDGARKSVGEMTPSERDAVMKEFWRQFTVLSERAAAAARGERVNH